MIRPPYPDWSVLTDQQIIEVGHERPPGPCRDGLEAMCRKYVKPGMTIVEIGCFAGESSRIICQAMRDEGLLICVDTWERRFDNVERAERIFDQFASGNALVKKVKLESGDAVRLISDSSVDLVYIDANHEYEWVSRDIRLWRPKLKPGGICSGHDYYHDVKRAVDKVFPRVDVFDDTSWVGLCIA